jgi:hypothetical protein
VEDRRRHDLGLVQLRPAAEPAVLRDGQSQHLESGAASWRQPGLKLDYEIAMGVRRGEPDWKNTVDRLLAENQKEIDAILREYGVPLLERRVEAKP